jgi:hypothetical protein
MTMGILDIFRRRHHFETPSKRFESTFALPEGGRLDIFGEPPPIPAVNRIPGGALIASQGAVSDDAASDLEFLLTRVNEALRDTNSEVAFSTVRGPLSDVFSPSAPIEKVPNAVIWILNPAIFAGWSAGPALLQRLLDTILDPGMGYESLAQPIYILDHETPAGVVIVTALGNLGFGVRVRDPADPDIIGAVHRPDGVIVTALLGQSIPGSGTASEQFHALRHQKSLAQLAGDMANLDRIVGEELELLANHIFLDKSKAKMAVAAAPRLYRLLCQALDEGEASRRALFDELIRREPHLIFVVDANTHAVPYRSWPGIGKALEVFPDFLSAKAATCGDDPDKTVCLGDLAPRELFRWMTKEGAGVAIHVYYPEKAPRWMLLSPQEIQLLSEGRLPNLLTS